MQAQSIDQDTPAPTTQFESRDLVAAELHHPPTTGFRAAAVGEVGGGVTAGSRSSFTDEGSLRASGGAGVSPAGNPSPSLLPVRAGVPPGSNNGTALVVLPRLRS